MRAKRASSRDHLWGLYKVSEMETATNELERTQAPAPCVLTVDDQPHFRSALRALVEATSGLVLAGEADCGEAAVALVRELQPDVVLRDVRLPGLGGVEATNVIKHLRPETIVVLVSTTHPDDLGRDARECGADGVVWKGDLRPKLLDDIWARRRAHKHDRRI
jgi:DNA-binding NarL/FixJ family response regulator